MVDDLGKGCQPLITPLAQVKTPRSRERIQRQIAATDQAIDELVYELYDLTDEEIAIVEGQA